MTTSTKSNKPLALGFIGGGLSSAIGQIHFGASQLDSKWKVEAGCFSRKPEFNIKTANTWHISPNRSYNTWQDLIKDEAENLDAIAVLTPTPGHIEIINALLENNIPIICEKPLVSSLEEALQIKNAFKKEKKFLAVTFNYSGYPLIRELRERIKKGELGQIKHIRFEVPQDAFVRSTPAKGNAVSWRLKDGYLPTICLDLGVHLHHLTYFLLEEEPTHTMAEFSNYSSHNGLVDDILMWVRFDSGIKGNFWMSKAALGNRNGLKISLYGDKGSAHWVQIKPEELKLYDGSGTCTIIDRGGETLVCGAARYNRYKAGHPAGFLEAFANLYSDIADAYTQFNETGKYDNPYVFGMEHSIKGLNLFTAACRSNDERSWKKLELLT